MSFLGIGKKENALGTVQMLRQKGMSDSQIIQQMQKSGYNPQEIHDALSQADLQPTDQALPNLDTTVPPLPQEAPAAPASTPAPPPASMHNVSSKEESQLKAYKQEEMQDMVEEIAESIIEEKWDELLKDINKMVEWKDKTENRLTALDQKFSDLKGNFDELHKAIISKIGEYDQNILNVGAEIKAMEKVFQDVLPVFTDNVQELSRIVDKVKTRK